MRGWLKNCEATDIAMESTGQYWRPLWNVLEGEFDKGGETMDSAIRQPKQPGSSSYHSSASAIYCAPWGKPSWKR
jgi:hypothetical protein